MNAPAVAPLLSTIAKVALANALLLAGSSALLLVLVTVLAERFMAGHVAESVDAEIAILESEFNADGLRGARALIGERVRARMVNHDRRYRLEDVHGRMIAGNLDRWPATDAPPRTHFRLPSYRYPQLTEIVMEWTPLPGGARLVVGFDEIEIAQVRADLRRAAAWSFVAVVVLALGMGLVLTRGVLRPVDAIRRSALRIMEGELSHRIPLRGSGDEFDRLAHTLNAMLDRIGRLIASVRGATDDIAHDLRSPLTRLRARLEGALRDPPGVADAAFLESCLADLDQVLATFRALLRISSVESGLLRAEFAPCDLAVLLRDAVDFVEPLAETRHQVLACEAPPALPLEGHRDLLFQALVNLLDNAVKYGPPGGRVDARAGVEGQGLCVEIRDQGPGIPPEERGRIFERLCRLDTARQTPGLGLGLPLVKAIVDVHGGRIEVAADGPGAGFRVWLPRARGAPEATA